MQTRSSDNIPGIDVSKYQGTIDWAAVATSGKARFAYIKATEGVGYVDPQLARNAEQAAATGLRVGYYHYCRPETGNDPASEAAAFYRAVLSLPRHLPHVLDVEGAAEELGAEKLTEWCVAWLRAVEKLTGGQPVMIYTGASFACNILGYQLSRWPLWVAHYGVDQPLANGVWDRWAAFQYSSSGKVPGIAGDVDMNEMDVAVWRQYSGEDDTNMPMKLEQWQWDMLYQVLGKAYNANLLQWDWLQKIIDKTLTASELAFLNTVLDGRIDRKIEV